jgi:hypothetical protein
VGKEKRQSDHEPGLADEQDDRGRRDKGEFDPRVGAVKPALAVVIEVSDAGHYCSPFP